jgi:hypothetical protein
MHMTQTTKICRELQEIIDSSILMGAKPYPLIEARRLLLSQEFDISRVTSTDEYEAGYNAGYSAAFATGLVGDDNA